MLTPLVTLLALLLPVQPPIMSDTPLTPTQLRALRTPPAGEAREALIRDLETLMRLEPNGPFENHGLLVSLEANLDQQPDIETAVLFGRQDRETLLLVINAQGIIQARIPVSNWYGSPELMLVTLGQTQKALVVRQIEEHGTGIYRESYHFYQLRNGQVKGVLRLPGEARLYGPGPLNQHLRVRWQALSGGEDALRVRYQYRFFPGPSQFTEENPNWSWLDSSEEVDFLWNEKQQAYVPDFYPSHPLNPEKLLSLESLGDPRFFKAFRAELTQRWQQASPAERQRMRNLGWK
jgi:hypothetical protein